MQKKPINLKQIDNKIRGLSYLIGNTPLLSIQLTYKGVLRTVHVKAENLNMTGSIKDRMALHIIRKAYAAGRLKPDDPIAEATSGNTGIAFAAIGRALGHPVTIFMPEWMSRERMDLIHGFGATIRLVTPEEGGFLGSIKMAEDMAKKDPRVFLPRQFENADNVEAHYLTTGPEIWWQLRFQSLRPDAFVAGVGTGGTIMGAGRYLREKNPAVKLYPMEPENSPTMSTGHKVGKHRIQGISDEFIPSIVKLDKLDDIICVDDGDSIIMAQRIAAELGLGVGISSGANLLAALKVQDLLGPQSVVVTVFSDDNKKYLTTDLVRQELVKKGFLSPQVELHGFTACKRVCYTCCDPEDCLKLRPLGDDDDVDLTIPSCPRRVCTEEGCPASLSPLPKGAAK
jgi:cysteine synthase A